MFSLSYNNQKKLIILLFLMVPVALLILFSYYPAAKLFELSFSNWNGYDPQYSHVGFANYVDLFKDTDSFTTMKNSGAYLVILFIQTVLALFLAIILDGNIRGKNFFRTAIFLPYILNGMAVAYMFNFFYNFTDSPINIVLRNMGLGQFAIKFLGESYLINFSLAFIGLWRYTGLSMVIFLGALQSIPKENYEAAGIDGANFFQSIRYITLPSIKNIIQVALFLGFNGALQVFFEPFIITKGGPGTMSLTYVYQSIKVAFEYKNFGKASAMGVVLLFIILIVVGAQQLIVNRKAGNQS